MLGPKRSGLCAEKGAVDVNFAEPVVDHRGDRGGLLRSLLNRSRDGGSLPITEHSDIVRSTSLSGNTYR